MGFLTGFLLTIVPVTSVLLIIVVLLQRGRGGGLAGAFGGMGGASAFGTKATSTFMKITIVLAVVWILGCIALVKTYSQGRSVVRGVGTVPDATEGGAAGTRTTPGAAGTQPGDAGGAATGDAGTGEAPAGGTATPPPAPTPPAAGGDATP